MAVWGVPVARDGHAIDACRAALDIRGAIDRLNRSGDLAAPIGFRIGINSGILVAGNMGGEQHRNYSVLGDNVNLASRLEAINNSYGTRLIISEFTADQVGGRFELRELDLVAVKGKQQGVRIFELQALAGAIGNDEKQLNQMFAEGLARYRQMDWSAAVSTFEGIVAKFPDDAPSQLLIERCLEFEQFPPPSPWDGVYRMTTK